MKRLPLIVFCLLLLPSLQAQRISSYAVAGVIASQIEGDELKGFSHWGLHGGVGAIAQLDDIDRWSLSLEADYSCRGIYNQKYSADNYYNIDKADMQAILTKLFLLGVLSL